MARATSPAMSNLAKDFRAEMAAHFTLARPEIVTEQISSDGTRKWLLRTGPGIEFETVYIPEADRGTLCVSSQVGCTLNCRFCHTGTQKLVRNLTPDGDCRPDAGGAATRWATGPVNAPGAESHQCRDDGHGRAAL